jgi:hypothetical protein
MPQTKIRLQMWWNLFQKNQKKIKKIGNFFFFFTIWQELMGSVSKES